MFRLKSFLYRLLGKKNYLLLMSKLFLVSYKMKLFKEGELKQHYAISKLIKAGDYVIDFGANLGYYSYIFSEAAGKMGKIYSVEPIPLYQEVFKNNCAGKSNINLIPYALGAEEKVVEMALPPGEIYRHGLMRVLDEGEKNSNFSYRVEMKDALEVFKDIPKLNYIKCDVEGFEKTILFRIKPIIEKYIPKVQVEIKDNKEEILDFFFSLGYKLYSFQDEKLIQIERNNEKAFSEDVWFVHIDDKVNL
ncbi:MAG: FkbM family methyltransferase [Bacteroidetes bacterium]|nr:FkbM family methyltransferase [Bacteroidota bacterium]